jgi:hypothetical protein
VVAEFFTADHQVVLSYGGLDLCPPPVAPWLLGCPGTRRQRPVSAASRGFRRPDEMAAPGTCRHRPTPGQSERYEQSSGLLIRGFGVQVPSGAPGLTWGFTTPGHFLSVCFVPVAAPWLLARTDPAIRVLSKTARPVPGAGAFAPDRHRRAGFPLLRKRVIHHPA